MKKRIRYLILALVLFVSSLQIGVLTAMAAESVSVDFGTSLRPMTYVASGFLHGFSYEDGMEPPDDLVKPLKIQSHRTDHSKTLSQMDRMQDLGITQVDVLSDSWGYGSRPMPGDNGDWSAYEQMVEDQVNDLISRGVGNTVWLDIWNEPDDSYFWSKSYEQFKETWKRGYQKIRSLVPDAIIVGPSWSLVRPGDPKFEDFLVFAKNNNVVPNYLSWHYPYDIVQEVQDARDLLAQHDITVDGISINEYARQYEQYPGTFAYILSQFERAEVENASNGVWLANVFLDNFVYKDANNVWQKKGNWWTYKGYGDITGDKVQTTGSASVDLVAGKDDNRQEAHILLGARTRPNQGSVTVHLNNIHQLAAVVGNKTHVVVERIPYSNGGDVSQVQVVSDEDRVVSGNSLDVVIPWPDSRDAYTIRLDAEIQTSNDATLSGLIVQDEAGNAIALSPEFTGAGTEYSASVGNGVNSVKLTPTASGTHASIQVNDQQVNNGSPSGAVSLVVGLNTIRVKVTGDNGTTKTYTVQVTREAAVASETVKVDFGTSLGAPKYAAAGFLHGFSYEDGTEPPDDLVVPLHIQTHRTDHDKTLNQADRLQSLGITQMDVLSDSWGYGSRPMPGDNGDWTAYDSLIETQVNQAIARGLGDKLQFEIWSGPDNSYTWPRSFEQFLDMWKRAYEKIRSMVPDAVIVGPSWTGTHPGEAKFKDFLEYARDNHVVPNYLSWQFPQDIGKEVQDAKDLLNVLGITVDGISINGYGTQVKESPGKVAHMIGQLERAEVDQAVSTVWLPQVMLNDYVYKDPEGNWNKRGAWWVYEGYGGIAGNKVQTIASENIELVAGKDDTSKTAQIILGASGDLPQGGSGVAVQLNNIGQLAAVNGNKTHLIVERIPYNGGAAVAGPQVVADEVKVIANNQLQITIPWTDNKDAYVIRLDAPASQQQIQTTLSGTDIVEPGKKFAITYGLSGVSQSVYAQDIKLDYNAAVMEFVSAKSMKEGISIVKIVKDPAGKLRLIVAGQGSEHAVSSDAQLVELTFRAKNVAQSTTGIISITSAMWGDGQGNEFEAAPSSVQVTTGIIGDINGDGKVTVADLALVAAHYGKNPGSPDWEQARKADVNGDGKVDMQDFAAVVKKMIE